MCSAPNVQPVNRAEESPDKAYAGADVLQRGSPAGLSHHHPFQDVKTELRTALEKAGLSSEIRFHDLRHCYATRLAAKGADAATMMDLLRHRSLKMVMGYVHPAEGTKRQAVELLSNHGHNMVTLAKTAHLEAQVAGA